MIKNFKQFCDTPFDVIVLAGQSNAQGGGCGSVENYYQRDERVCFLADTKTFGLVVNPETDDVSLAADCPSVTNIKVAEDDGGGNLIFTFARNYAKNYLQAGRKLLIIQAAVGGTGFTRGEWRVKTGKLYYRMLSMVDEALQLNKENRLVGFLWHQGEHDAFERADHDVKEIEDFYYENFKALLTSFRERYEQSDLPVVAAGFVDEWRVLYEKQCEAVCTGIKRVFSEIGNAAFVEAYGLKSNNQTVGNGDNIHFSREAIYALGEKYYNAFQNIIEK